MGFYAVCKAGERVANDQSGRVEGVHNKLAGGTNIEGAVAGLQEDRAAIQRDVDELSCH